MTDQLPLLDEGRWLEPVVSFICYGKPQQRGSKQVGVQYDRATGKPKITQTGRVLTFAKDDNEKSRAWMEVVASAAGKAYSGELLTGPLNLTAQFYFPRVKSHYRHVKAGTFLRDDAPIWHFQTPDLAKLIRSLEDAITGVVWMDDSQVVAYEGSYKKWTGEQSRCEVVISRVLS